MSKSVLILGRQPAIGLAELESLYGPTAVKLVGINCAVVDVEPAQLNFSRLGGSVKAGEILDEFASTELRDLERHLSKLLPTQVEQITEGKLTIGFSAYGLNTSAGQLNALGLTLKKAIRKHSQRSVRLVPNNDLELNSAQVYHNHLTTERNWEILLIRDNDRTIIARAFAVQDIDAYTVRDRGRPKRDARVGMLPPKLAQIIVNLAVGQLPIINTTAPGLTILDPFCGTGVLLQEAQLMGYDIYGTDLEPRMIDYTRQNLEWLTPIVHNKQSKVELKVADATDYHWNLQPNFVAAETYLGKPFTSRPDPATLSKTVGEVDLILRKFLKNIHPQLKPGARLCLAVPAWNLAPKSSAQKTDGSFAASASASRVMPNAFKFLPLIDQISNLGYNRIRFEHVRDDQLLYYREDQIVARQLIVLTRN